MKPKHVVLVALLILAVNACSDDDSDPDPCESACNKLSSCGMGVNCGGTELEVGPCVSFCQQRQAHGAARCVLDVPRCIDTNDLASCAAQMPCN